MESYKDFAFVYDALIDQDYEKWANYYEEIFKRYNHKPKLILDLGCGTGSLSVIMAKRGYDVLGVDISEDMLSVASQKSADLNLDIRFLCQDITDFELYGTVDCIYSTMDVLNYITDKRKLKKVFKLVNNYLNPGGLFIFDLNTEYKYEKVLANNTFVCEKENIFYTWENEYNKKSGINNAYINFFEEEDGAYNRIFELHTQKAYKSKYIKDLLTECGLFFLDEFKFQSFDKPTKTTEKSIFVAKCFC